MGAWLSRVRGARFIGIIALCALLAAAALAFGGERMADGQTDIETRMERALERVEGAGRVRVLVNEYAEGEARITGVVVIAEGAGDARVYLALQSAAQVLLGAEAARVEVLKMEGG